MDKELVTMRNQMMLFVLFLLITSKVTTADFVNTSTTDDPSTTPVNTSTTDGPSTTPVNTSTTDDPSTTPGPLYPFGAGDTVSSRSDDGSSPPITLEQPFVYFGKPYQQIHVNHNGHLTFNAAFTSYTPYRFPAFSSRDLIAPFWTDLDNRRNGTISYRQYSSGSVLQQATQDINQYFPNLGFSVNWVFVATWDKVPYYNTFGTEITFQVVLIAGGQSSFILMNYGEIAPTTQNIQAGYDTVNSIHYFSIPGSFQSNDTTFSYTSNVNVAGRWAFQTNATTSTTDGPSTTPVNTSTTDDPSTTPGPLYPFGAGDTVSSRSDDGSSPPITLEQPFVYFGKPYQQIHVNHNGHLTFNAAFTSYTPYRFPAFSSRDLIAPFWTDLDNRRNGTISYRQYSSGSVLQQATQDINQYFPNLGFSVNWVFVATWDKVPYYNTFGTEITFQVVLIAGGQSSFILMNYGEIAPTTQNIQAGYDTVNSIHYFSIPGSFQSNDTTFSYTSNVNVAGRWAFQTNATTSTTDGPSTTPVNTSTTDDPSTTPGPLYPFGAGDTVSSRSDDGSSPPITLEQPFVYFGKPYQQIHVNHNGHLTFNAAFTSYTPYRFPAFSSRDLIAPFWTDLDNRRNGTISYRQYSSGSVLQQATQDINQYFPNLGFSVNWVFVATWDKVPYYNTFGTEITFQVVLIAGGQSSFILMNYGEIAPTTQNIQAGYDTVNSIHYFSIPGSFQSNDTTFSYTSNVNVAGRWAFQTNATTSTTDGPSTTPASTSDEPFAIDDFCIDSIFCKGQGLTGSVYMLSTLLILVFLTILNN